MSQTMQDKLAAKAAARALESSALNPAPVVGVASSVEVAAVDPTPTKKPAMPDYPEGCYVAERQRYLIMHDGTKVLPDAYGVYVPANYEQRKMLELFDERNIGLVTKLVIKK